MPPVPLSVTPALHAISLGPEIRQNLHHLAPISDDLFSRGPHDRPVAILRCFSMEKGQAPMLLPGLSFLCPVASGILESVSPALIHDRLDPDIARLACLFSDERAINYAATGFLMAVASSDLLPDKTHTMAILCHDGVILLRDLVLAQLLQAGLDPAEATPATVLEAHLPPGASGHEKLGAKARIARMTTEIIRMHMPPANPMA